MGTATSWQGIGVLLLLWLHGNLVYPSSVSEFAKLLDGNRKEAYLLRTKLRPLNNNTRGYRKLTKLEYRQGWRIEDRDGLPVLRKVRLLLAFALRWCLGCVYV